MCFLLKSYHSIPSDFYVMAWNHKNAWVNITHKHCMAWHRKNYNSAYHIICKNNSACVTQCKVNPCIRLLFYSLVCYHNQTKHIRKVSIFLQISFSKLFMDRCSYLENLIAYLIYKNGRKVKQLLQVKMSYFSTHKSQ